MAKSWDEKRAEFGKIQLIPEAAQEYNKLDGSVKVEVDKKFAKLNENPLLGLPLGNKAGMDLTGFYKIYACSKSIRIIYRLLSPEKVEIIEVWGIGRREKMEVYKNVDERKNSTTE